MNYEHQLHALCQELGEVGDQLRPLEEERRRIRAELSLVVEALRGRVTLDGFGRLEVCNASFVVSYDRKQVEVLILKLVDTGQYHLADALRSCKEESARPGALRIMRALPRV